MNVYKLSLCPVELLPGLTFDPATKLPPQLFGDDKQPLPGVLSYDWFED